jgi:GNAT superfamily N-acetyltransferase
LDRYLKEFAGQEIRRKTASVFVLCLLGSPRIWGFYSLSQTSIALSELPLAIRKKLPRYPKIPATLLGRLAVDRLCRGRGLGEQLLMDALYRSWKVSQQIAAYAVVIDVLELQPDPLAFYLNYGFKALPDSPRRVFFPLAECEKIFDS